MEGPILLALSLLAVGVLWFVVYMVWWMTYTKKGQRALQKSVWKRQVRQGLREAEVQDGLQEEVIREETERYMRKQARRQSG